MAGCISCPSAHGRFRAASAVILAALGGALPSVATAQPCWPYATQPMPPLQWFDITDMVGFESGTGWGLCVAGRSSTVENVVRWDGESWSDISPGNGEFITLAVFDSGTGPELYAGGWTRPPGGGMSIGVLARWNGTNWTHIDIAADGAIAALASFDDGTGPALYVGGRFTQAGGLTANNIVRWDGESWSALDTGLDSYPLAIAPFYSEPAGPALYVGGRFEHAGGVQASRIARWDGATWSSPGQGMNEQVRALAVFDDGTRPSLYAGGSFSLPAPSIARWDGFSWSAVGPPMEVTMHLMPFEAADGAFLYSVGQFEWIGGLWSPYAARWNGSEWSSFLNFTPEGLGSRATVTNDGAPALYLGFWDLGGSSFIRWGCEVEPAVCYANCDGSTVEPILNVDDFICFINEFATGAPLPHGQQLEHYANCDGSTTAPVLNVDDFTCFINAFSQGCR